MDQTSYQKAVQNHLHPLLVEIWAPWCLPCRKMGPVIDRLAKQFAGQVEVLKVNADESPELVRSLNVYGIPTVIAYWRGRELARRTGAQPEKELAAFFESIARREPPQARRLAASERLLRLGTGLALVGLGIAAGTWVLLLAGGVVAFSEVYDRCPVWQALAPRLAALLRRGFHRG